MQERKAKFSCGGYRRSWNRARTDEVHSIQNDFSNFSMEVVVCWRAVKLKDGSAVGTQIIFPIQ